MRSHIIFVLLLATSGLFVIIQTTSAPVPHIVVSPKSTASKETKGSLKAGESRASEESPAKSKPAALTKTAKAPEKPTLPAPKPRMKRPLRVIGLGWESIAPAIVANEGASDTARGFFAKRGLRVALSAATERAGIEAALARGGADDKGADVALLPLSSFVSGYERLRALSPQIIFVVGWSRGRHALLAAPNATLRSRNTFVVGKQGEPEVYLALTMLELAGVKPHRIRVVSSADKQAKRAPFRAVQLPRPADAAGHGRVLLSTADATHLIPIVAVSAAGFVKKHHDALLVWARGWLSGVDQLHQDVPAAARKIAKLPGAPDALALLKRLGQIRPATLLDNARLAGLSGREPVTLDRLFRHCWRLWRAAGLLVSPVPEKAPLSVQTMAALARIHPSLAEAPVSPARNRKRLARPTGDFQQLVAYEPLMRRWNRREAIEAIGFVAGLFHRAKLRVSVRDSLRQSKRIVDAVVERFALTQPERITAASRENGRLLRIEVQTIQ